MTGSGKISMTKSDTMLMHPEKTPRLCSYWQCPGVLGIHSFRRGLHYEQVRLRRRRERGFPQMTNTEDVHKSDGNVKQDDDPDGEMNCIVEQISSMDNEQGYVLQQDGYLDQDDDGVIDDRFDG